MKPFLTCISLLLGLMVACPKNVSAQSPRQLYERGVALADDGHTVEALSVFYQVLDVLGGADSLALRRDVNEQIASQFLYKGLTDEALEYADETVRLDSLLGDSVAARNALFVSRLREDRGESVLLHLQNDNMRRMEQSLRKGNVREAERHMQSHREWLEIARKYDRDARALLELHVLRKDSLSRVTITTLSARHRRITAWLVGSLSVLVVAVLFLTMAVRYNQQKRTLLKFKLEKLREMQRQRSSLPASPQEPTSSRLSPLPLPTREGSNYSQDVGNQVEKLSTPLPHREGQGGESVGGALQGTLRHFRQFLNNPDAKLPTDDDWQELSEVVNAASPRFSERLFDFCKMSRHEHRVCLLLKAGVKPSDIARLTAHSDEAITSSRRRLYQKAFGQKGTPKEWDEFIRSL